METNADIDPDFISNTEILALSVLLGRVKRMSPNAVKLGALMLMAETCKNFGKQEAYDIAIKGCDNFQDIT